MLTCYMPECNAHPPQLLAHGHDTAHKKKQLSFAGSSPAVREVYYQAAIPVHNNCFHPHWQSLVGHRREQVQQGLGFRYVVRGVATAIPGRAPHMQGPVRAKDTVSPSPLATCSAPIKEPQNCTLYWLLGRCAGLLGPTNHFKVTRMFPLRGDKVTWAKRHPLAHIQRRPLLATLHKLYIVHGQLNQCCPDRRQLAIFQTTMYSGSARGT